MAIAPATPVIDSPDIAATARAVPGQPFTVTEFADFDAPWAMDFLPGGSLADVVAALAGTFGGAVQ